MDTTTAYPSDLSITDFRPTLQKNRLKGLWKMLNGFHLPYLLATLSLAVSALARSGTFLLLRYFADHVLDASLSISLGWIALGFVALAATDGGFAFLSGRLAAYTAEGITRRLRDFLFDHIQRLSVAYHAHTPTGDLIERVTSDVDALRRFFGEQAIGIGRILILFVINFLAILRINARLGWLSVVVIPLVLAVSLWFFKKVTQAYEAYQAQEAILSTTLQENLSGVRVVKAFGRQTYEIAKFEKDNWNKFLKGKTLLLMHSLFWPLSDIVLGLQMLFGFVLAANMAIRGEISVGSYLAYTGLIVWLIWPIRNLGRIIVQTSTGMVSYGRLMEIVKQEREDLYGGSVQPQGELHGDLVFEDVCFMYADSEQDTLKNISFRVRAGQAVALLGSTGCGKTTLVNLLPRFYDYTAGHITWTARSSRSIRVPICASKSALSSKNPSCLAAPSARTSPMALDGRFPRRKSNRLPEQQPCTR